MKDSGIEWIGKIPEGWETCRLKNLADPLQENSFIDGDWIESPDITDEGIRYLTTGNVGDGLYKRQGNGYISQETFKDLNCKYAYPGDLVIARLNAPYGRSCILEDDEDSYVLAVDIVILRTLQDKRYICYYTQCPGYQRAVEDYSRGTAMKRISRNNLGNIDVLLPPLAEQQAIADYLDEKCAAIDKLIDNQKAQIEKMKEYKQSVITEAVTKGLNPSVPMKDSGIYNIGIIPKGWNVERIKRFLEICNGKEVQSDDGEIPVYGSGGIFKYTDRAIYDGESILFGRKGTIDKPILVKGVFWTVDTMFYTKGIHDIIIKYLYYCCIGLIDYQFYKSGSVLPSMTQSELGNVIVTIPPLAEQQAIADYLDEKCAAIDKLIAVKQAKIDKLNDYKKSLIYEYVTGKREVL